MLQFIPTHDEGSTLAIRASGKLTHQDYQSFLPKLEEKIKQAGKVSLLLELDNFSGWDLKAAKDDFTFALKHMGDLERIAIVGDKSWEHWMTIMAKPFLLLGSVRYYNKEQLQEAWGWLREKENLEVAAETLSTYQRILVPVDFSLASIHGCRRSIALAKTYNAKLSIIHIVEEMPFYVDPSFDTGDMAFSGSYNLELVEELDNQHLSNAKKQMEGFINHLKADIEIHSDVIIGNAKDTIISYLEAQDTNLVIFGIKKKKGLKRSLGSIPRKVQEYAKCETLLVPLVAQKTDNF